MKDSDIVLVCFLSPFCVRLHILQGVQVMTKQAFVMEWLETRHLQLVEFFHSIPFEPRGFESLRFDAHFNIYGDQFRVILR